MITRFEESEGVLVVESRYARNDARVRRLVAFSLIVAGLVLLLLLRLQARGGSGLPPVAYVFLLGLTLAPVLLIARSAAGSERIEVRGTALVHERRVGQTVRQRDEYDLLQMKGLRTTPVPGPESELEWTGIAFWYRSGPRSIGETLSKEERNRVIESLLAADRKVRLSLGMDTEAGLANTAYWNTVEAREANLAEIYSDQRFLG